jgi:hypothetical protein
VMMATLLASAGMCFPFLSVRQRRFCKRRADTRANGCSQPPVSRTGYRHHGIAAVPKMIALL